MFSLLLFWLASSAADVGVASSETIMVVCDRWEAPDRETGCSLHDVTTFGPQKQVSWQRSESCCFGSRVLETRHKKLGTNAYQGLRKRVVDANVFALPTDYGSDTSAFPQHFLTFTLGDVDQMLLIYTDDLPADVASLRQTFCQDIVPSG